MEPKVKQNGHITMETKPTKNVNAHLVKNGVICLDKSPVKPVMIETNETERNTDTDKKEREKEESGKSHKDQKEDLNSNEAEGDKPIKSENKDSEKTGSCICKKPVSFDLLPPSKHGKLASRQRFASESSYKKQHYPMVHTNSDPTGFDSQIVFGDAVEVKTGKVGGKDEKEKVKSEGEKDSSKTDIDTLADNLGSALKIASTSTSESKVEVKEEADKQISDLADNLQTSLHVKDKELKDSSGSDVIVVKKEGVSISPKEEIVIKKEPVDDNEKSLETIEIKQEPKDETSESCKKKGEAGSVSGRLPENNKQMVSRGVQGDGQTPFGQPVPMQGMYPHSYQQSGNTNITIPSFQEAFVRNDQQQQMQLLHQRQMLSQPRRYVQQSVQPPCYLERHHQQQQIILPPSTQGNQPIIVPPASGNHQSMTNFQTQQAQHRQFGISYRPHQNHYPMPLQEPQTNMVVLPSSRKQPEENAWPGTHDDLSDTTSIPSPYLGEDTDPIASPPSVGSDVGSNQVNSPLSSQGSPHNYTPTSPYHTVPTLSPEMPLAHSPSVPSPGSPNSHTITTGGSNFGVVTINKPSSPPQTKRQRLSESDRAAAKNQEIGQIVEYLKHGSPGQQESEQNPSSPAYNYQPVSPAGSGMSSDSSTPPPSMSTATQQYQLGPQASPPPGMSPVVAQQPQQATCYPYQSEHHPGMVPTQSYYSPGMTTLAHSPHTHQTQQPVDAMIPTQVANQQEYELQEWRQKVSTLTEAQLKEQDEDKDT